MPLPRFELRQFWRDLATAAGLAATRCTVCGAVCDAAHAAAYMPVDAPENGENSQKDPKSDPVFMNTIPAPLPGAIRNRAIHAAPLCPACTHGLRSRTGGFCSRCGMIFADCTLPTAPCATCLTTPPPWDSLSFVAAYTDLMRRCILRFKFHNALELGAMFGSMLAARCLENGFSVDAVIPIPLHGKRLHERGYNQTREIARPIAAALDTKLAPALLKRGAATPHQTGLSRKQRSENLRNAFSTPEPERLAGKRILLVDDIMTTGATIIAAATALRAAGTAEIHVAVVARTPDVAGR